MSSVLDPFRLPRHVLPRHYGVSLAPRLDQASFDGSVTITADVVLASPVIVLNSIELAIHSVSVDGKPCAYVLDDNLERLTIDCGVTPGPVTISIAFTGTLNDKLRGFYRSTFVDEAGVTRVIATTQMQSTDCRRAFPCFDEPDFKATFSVDLTVDSTLMAVANTRETKREDVGDGRTRIWFAETMVMSTYLVAFIVGPLEATPTVMVGDIPLRIVHAPGKGHLTEFGMRIGAFALEWFQTYYGIPYPGDKVDLIALPDFAAGAMENVGCITFREVLLLVDPATATQVEQERVADVVAHELAHMWFGDLVTMRWWNGIWLNEAFATFMEVAACDAFAPQWQRWTSFGLERSAAFDTDSLHSTRTIEFPVQSPADADGMFDVLTYEKGGAILRMLEQYLGPDRFRAGVSHYLRVHSYGNTETSDLWDAIEHVVSTDGGPVVPVRKLMDSWIWQAGYPLVSARLDGSTLVLAQRRFTYDNDPDATIWVIPVHIHVGGRDLKVLLEGDEARVAIPDPTLPVVINAGGSGFFRVEYSSELLGRITGDALSSLSTLERYNLVDDAWNALVADALEVSSFINFLRGFDQESELAVWQAIHTAIRGMSRLLSEDESRFNRFVAALVTPALVRLGWSPVTGESDLTAKLRGLLVQLLAVHGADSTAQRRCRDILFNKSETEPELVAAATNVVAATGDASDYDWFLDRFSNSATPQEKIRMLYALAEFDDADLMQRTADFAFSDAVKTQDAPFLLNRCIANRRHGELAWKTVRQNWAKANEVFPGNSIIRMASAVATLNTPSLETEIQSFFSEHPIPQAGKMLDQVLERQRVNVALRSRTVEALALSLGA